MNQDERAALERLLEYVGRGFCAVQSDCKMLREFLTNRKALDALTNSFLAAAAKTTPARLKRPAPKKTAANPSKQAPKRTR